MSDSLDPYMTEIEHLERKVHVLQSQLEAYFRLLQDAENQRHEFQLGATWNIVIGASLLAAGWTTAWVSRKLEIGSLGFIGGFLMVLIFIAIYGALVWWAEKGKRDDLARLRDLPEWGSEQFLERWKGRW